MKLSQYIRTNLPNTNISAIELSHLDMVGDYFVNQITGLKAQRPTQVTTPVVPLCQIGLNRIAIDNMMDIEIVKFNANREIKIENPFRNSKFVLKHLIDTFTSAFEANEVGLIALWAIPNPSSPPPALWPTSPIPHPIPLPIIPPLENSALNLYFITYLESVKSTMQPMFVGTDSALLFIDAFSKFMISEIFS